MELEIYQVDSFTDQAFKGNPAGVCISDSELDEALMYSIAEEMAVSETAFLSLNNMRLRWFTPKVEVNLCGHGTLAVAHILKQTKRAMVGDSIVFNTKSGALSAKLNESTVELDFLSPTLLFDQPTNEVLLEYLGLKPEHVLSYGLFDSKNFIEVVSEEILCSLEPNFDALNQLSGRGVLITAQSDSDDMDFISRYFAPWVGVNEDPVTGSAHCALAVYWAEKLNKSILNGYQASIRGGYVGCEILSNGRVKLIGRAVTTIEGKMHV